MYVHYESVTKFSSICKKVKYSKYDVYYPINFLNIDRRFGVPVWFKGTLLAKLPAAANGRIIPPV